MTVDRDGHRRRTAWRRTNRCPEDLENLLGDGHSSARSRFSSPLLDCDPQTEDAQALAENEYATPEHALAYLAKADGIPHRVEGEAALLSFVPRTSQRILDLGTGDGRLLTLLHAHCPDAELVGLDFSPTMIAAAKARFAGESRVNIVDHDLDDPLPTDLQFDAIVSSFAIHHCADARKRSLYREIHNLLSPGGTFCNLEHVASPTDALHQRFLAEIGVSPSDEDPSNILLDVQSQLEWLREIGYEDVDCYWKWLELALLGGVRRKSDGEL